MTRQINDAGLSLIKQFEGLSLTVYNDIGGDPTVGYGHLIKDGEDFSAGISQETADSLLKEDLSNAEESVETHITSELSDNQFAAIVSLVYNVGVKPLLLNLGTLLNAGDYDDAASHILLYNECNGQPNDGLTRRREAEKELFES